MMEQVVEKGTGKNAYLEGYRVAGKTGTAQMWSTFVSRGEQDYKQMLNGIDKNDEYYYGSIVCVMPAKNPKYTIYVGVCKQKMFGGEKVTLFLRLHPNLLGKADTSELMSHPSIIDMTRYHDMQELLSVADMLITDYSSSMFDFSMQRRPCLLYATDIEQYDRGYYYDFTKLPYPLARNQEDLLRIISEFNNEEYGSRLADFLDNELGVVESGVAAKALAEWMVNYRK